MARIAVIGPGAIGGTVATRLAEISDHVITVCARSAVTLLTVDTVDGIKTAAPEVLLSPDQGRPVDWVLVATKAYDVASAAEWLQRLMGSDTRLAVLQNGVEHVERFAPYVSKAQIVPVIVDMPVERIAPGRFRQRRAGRFTVTADANGKDFAQLFVKTGIEVFMTSDFRSAAWRKLAVNCAGAFSALTLKPAGIVNRLPIADIMRALVCECIAVGRAEGADLDDCLVETVLDGYRTAPSDAINSLHADRLAGRPMEIDARNGAIVRLGRKHNIDTPVNRIVVALLEAAA
jgi:2-dehydropantoate 2-reductase